MISLLSGGIDDISQIQIISRLRVEDIMLIWQKNIEIPLDIDIRIFYESFQVLHASSRASVIEAVWKLRTKWNNFHIRMSTAREVLK